MSKGMDRYSDKNRRKIRRRNHVARDLAETKYRQRVKQGKRRSSQNKKDWRDYGDEYTDLGLD